MDRINKLDPSTGSGPQAKSSGFGDNLEVLRASVPSESVDLIYLDPPFNSNASLVAAIYDRRLGLGKSRRTQFAATAPGEESAAQEAASAGFYQSEGFGEKHPRLQILTIAELLDGKQLRYPRHRVEAFEEAG